MDYLFWSLCHWGSTTIQILQAIVSAIDNLSNLDSIILLLNAPHTWVIENIKLLVIWMLHLSWLASIMLEGVVHATGGENHQSYLLCVTHVGQNKVAWQDMTIGVLVT